MDESVLPLGEKNWEMTWNIYLGNCRIFLVGEITGYESGYCSSWPVFVLAEECPLIHIFISLFLSLGYMNFLLHFLILEEYFHIPTRLFKLYCGCYYCHCTQ